MTDDGHSRPSAVVHGMRWRPKVRDGWIDVSRIVQLHLKLHQFNKKISLAMTLFHNAVTRIRTWVTAATTQGTNHYTITANRLIY